MRAHRTTGISSEFPGCWEKHGPPGRGRRSARGPTCSHRRTRCVHTRASASSMFRTMVTNNQGTRPREGRTSPAQRAMVLTDVTVTHNTKPDSAPRAWETRPTSEEAAGGPGLRSPVSRSSPSAPTRTGRGVSTGAGPHPHHDLGVQITSEGTIPPRAQAFCGAALCH